MPSEKKSTAFIDPRKNSFLREYFSILQENYRYISFLETGIDNRERGISMVSSDRLFVEPEFSAEYIDPQSKVDGEGELQSLIEMISDEDRIFILGDPGAGKTTLFNRITYILSNIYEEKLLEKLSFPIPFHITLRELDFSKINQWEDLRDVIFIDARFKGLSLDHEVIEQIFNTGQFILLLDGLDEIHQEDIRKKLADLLEKTVLLAPKGKYWITSRIVGFDKRRFFTGEDRKDKGEKVHGFREVLKASDEYQEEHFRKGKMRELIRGNAGEEQKQEILAPVPASFNTFFLSPFSLRQIKKFLSLWMRIFGLGKEDHEEFIQKFLSSLEDNPSILHLARIPNFLTMMAIYFRVNEVFPDGRVELLHNTVKLYLEKINRTRKIPAIHQLSYDEMFACFTELGYRMQELRAESKGEQSHYSIPRQEAEAVFLGVLSKGEITADLRQKVSSFFDSLHKKADLLLPRGTEQIDGTETDVYGFLHLSLQEFFAAIKLENEFENVMIPYGDEDPETYFTKLKAISAENAWHESILLLFEEFVFKKSAAGKKIAFLFGKLFGGLGFDYEVGYGNDLLAAKILTDSYVSEKIAPDSRWTSLTTIFGRSLEWGATYKYLKKWGLKYEYYLSSPPPPENKVILNG